MIAHLDNISNYNVANTFFQKKVFYLLSENKKRSPVDRTVVSVTSYRRKYCSCRTHSAGRWFLLSVVTRNWLYQSQLYYLHLFQVRKCILRKTHWLTSSSVAVDSKTRGNNLWSVLESIVRGGAHPQLAPLQFFNYLCPRIVTYNLMNRCLLAIFCKRPTKKME